MDKNHIKIAVSIILPAGNQKFWYVLNRKDKKWGLPGGKPKPEEDMQNAIIREAREELGIIPHLENIVGLYRFTSSRQHPILNIVYRGAIKDGSPHVVNPKEIENIQALNYYEVLRLLKSNDLRSGKANLQPLDDYLIQKHYPLKIICHLK